MEIKTCEQYVLDQLEQARAERDWLRGKLEQAQDEAEELRGKLMERGERDASKVEQAIRKEGRAKLYRDGTGYRTSVSSGSSLIPFEDWCMEHVGVPKPALRNDQDRVHRLLRAGVPRRVRRAGRRVEGGAGMIGIYERSLCQSYASAYRQGILIAKTDDEAEALSIVESLTSDSYQCFALLEDGTVLDLRGRFPGCVEVVE